MTSAEVACYTPETSRLCGTGPGFFRLRTRRCAVTVWPVLIHPDGVFGYRRQRMLLSHTIHLATGVSGVGDREADYRADL